MTHTHKNLLSTLFLCFVALATTIAQAADIVVKSFASGPKTKVTLVASAGFAIGPMALTGTMAAFSRRVFDAGECLGRDVYLVDLDKPTAPAHKVAEVACVISLAKSSNDGLLIRQLNAENKLVTQELTKDSVSEWSASFLQNAKVSSQQRLGLFDVGGDFIDGKMTEVFPLNVNGWALSWFASTEKNGDYAVSLFKEGRSDFRQFAVPQASTFTRHASFSSLDGKYAFLPTETELLWRATRAPADEPVQRLGQTGSAPSEAQLSTETELPANDWRASRIASLKPSATTESGAWILDESRASNKPASQVWFYDIENQSLYPTVALQNLGVGVVTSLHPLTNGLLVGTEDGAIHWIKASKSATPATPEGGQKQRTTGCDYFYSTQERGGTTVWVFFYQGSGLPQALVETAPLTNTQWTCRGDRLALLSKNIRLRWAKGESSLSLQSEEPTGSLHSNVAEILRWQTEIPARTCRIEEQDEFAKNNARTVLLSFSKDKLVRARTAFSGTEFSGIAKDPKQPGVAFIEVAPSVAEAPALPYRWVLDWESDALEGGAL